jgi:hypothetical protein
MKALTIIFLTLSSFLVLSDIEYADVIEMKLSDDCSLVEMTALKNQFNDVLENKGWDCRAEIWQPIQRQDITTVYWIGRAPSFPDFAQEFTEYFEEATKGNTPEADLETSMANCRVNLSRSGFSIQ